MTSSNSRRDFVIALLIAVWAHVGLFFLFVLLVVFDLLSATVIDSEAKEPKKEEVPSMQMKVVYAEPPLVEPVPPAPAPEPLAELEPEEVPEPEPTPEPTPAAVAEPVMPDTPAFVQTDESQAAEEVPEETPLIGERNTTATSDAGAVEGNEKMAALSGTQNRRGDPKTFDSDFLEGEASGPKGGMTETLEAGQGDELENQEASVIQDAQPEPVDEPLPEMEEELPKPMDAELASIDDTLAALDEAIGEREEQKAQKEVVKVEETIPERPATEEKEAAKQDGGFAPKATKTRIAGVLSTSGEGSLNVADTPAGRYQAAILKKLETIWQMDNITNRSLNAPGQITLYFIVDQKGQVSRQRQLSRVGTSDNQWGRVLGVVGRVAIPKMPKAVLKDLDGDTLELIVTFNY